MVKIGKENNGKEKSEKNKNNKEKKEITYDTKGIR